MQEDGGMGRMGRMEGNLTLDPPAQQSSAVHNLVAGTLWYFCSTHEKHPTCVKMFPIFLTLGGLDVEFCPST